MADSSVLVQQPKPTPKPRRSKNNANVINGGNNNNVKMDDIVGGGGENSSQIMQISGEIDDKKFMQMSDSSISQNSSQFMMNGSMISSSDEEMSKIIANTGQGETVSPTFLNNGETVSPMILNSRPNSLFQDVQNNIGVLNSPTISSIKDDNTDFPVHSGENAFENPEYAEFQFYRPKPLNDISPSHQPVDRASNLIWFESKVPEEFIKQSSNIIASINFDRLYPDLTEIKENETAWNNYESSNNGGDAIIPKNEDNCDIEEILSARASVDRIPASVASYYSDSTIRLSSYSQRVSSDSRFNVEQLTDEEPVAPFDGKLVLETSPVPSVRIPNKDLESISIVSSGNEDSKSSRESVQSSTVVVPTRPQRVEPRSPPSIVVKPHRPSSSNTPVSSNVCYVGWLTKLGSKKKDNVRRWSILNNGNLSFFTNDETTDKSLENILCKNIVFITVESQTAYSKDSQLNDNQYLFGIFYSKVNTNGKLEHLSFSVDSHEERSVWVTLLSKIIIPGETAELYEEWEKGWMLMVGYSLLYSCESDKCSFEIDARKIMRLRTVDDVTDHCPMIKAGNGYPFVITTEGSALYVQNGNSIITETWKTGIESILTQRTSVLMDQRLNFDDIPVLVEKCINFIAVHGMNVEGIHRLSGTSSKIRVLFEEFQKDPYSVHLRIDDYSVHDVASVLRKFFRQLREPLITAKLRPVFIEISCVEERGTRRIEYKKLLHELPNVNYRTLRKILGHLKSVTDNSNVNMMNVQNLSAIFGPTLFSVDRDAVEGVNFTSTSQAINTIAEMILYYNWLFDVGESEAQKEAEIQQKVNDLRDYPKKPLAGNLLLSIHTVQKDGVCFNMQITNNLLPSDVCDFAVSGRKINALRQEVALFEVICNGELQRLILPDEKVLDVVSRWTTWPLEERANNYLIVKLDFVTERVKSIASAQTLFPTCEVQFSESKSFKKSLFQFTQGVIVQFKDSKAKNKVNQWTAENLLWYFGCEAKRQPPTRHCLTFLTKDDSVKRSKSFPFFGKTLCFKDEVDMYKWLCTVLLINESFLSKNEF